MLKKKKITKVKLSTTHYCHLMLSKILPKEAVNNSATDCFMQQLTVETWFFKYVLTLLRFCDSDRENIIHVQDW